MSTRPVKLAALLLLAALLIAPAAAKEEVHWEDATIFTAEATDQLTILSIRSGNCPPNSQQTYYLEAYGLNYTVNVVNTQSWGYWNYNISCTYPDGSTEYQELSRFAPYAIDYDLTIQRFYAAADWLLDVDISVGLLPSLSAGFNLDAGLPLGPASVVVPILDNFYYDPDFLAIAFSSVTGTSTEPADFTAIYVTWGEFETIQEDNLLSNIALKFGAAAEDLFNWTWDGALYVVGKIPYVGEHLETFCLITGFALEEIAFWLYLFFIEYPELTFGMVEFLIIADALINTRTLWKLLERIVDDHVKLAEFLLKLLIGAIDMITKIISAVAAAIGSIKIF